MRVLVVDDDLDILAVVVRALERDGHAVTATRSLAEARQAAALGIDLMVLDLGLPDGSGLELCRELRQQAHPVPILILTAYTQIDQRVGGLDAGADDYLSKPFAVIELRARVRALGRRGPVERSVVYTFNEVSLDFRGRRAKRAGVDVPVTAREWAILEFLAARRERFNTRDEVLAAVWGDTSESAANSFDVLMTRLRRKFGAGIIETVKGRGYGIGGTARVAEV